MPTTPDYLRGNAVAMLIGAIHNAHMGGPWSLIEVNTYHGMTSLEYKVGIVRPEGEDNRQTIRFTVEEI